MYQPSGLNESSVTIFLAVEDRDLCEIKTHGVGIVSLKEILKF